MFLTSSSSFSKVSLSSLALNLSVIDASINKFGIAKPFEYTKFLENGKGFSDPLI